MLAVEHSAVLCWRNCQALLKIHNTIAAGFFLLGEHQDLTQKGVMLVQKIVKQEWLALT